MRDDCPISRNCIVRQAEVLGLAEQRGYSVAMLEAKTGIPAQTLRTYVDKPSRPASMMSFAAVIKLAKALPDDLANLLLEDSGYDLKPRQGVEKDWLGFAARASRFSEKVLRYQSTDGFIDHREDADLTEEARGLAADAQAMTVEQL